MQSALILVTEWTSGLQNKPNPITDQDFTVGSCQRMLLKQLVMLLLIADGQGNSIYLEFCFYKILNLATLMYSVRRQINAVLFWQ